MEGGGLLVSVSEHLWSYGPSRHEQVWTVDELSPLKWIVGIRQSSLSGQASTRHALTLPEPARLHFHAADHPKPNQ